MELKETLRLVKEKLIKLYGKEFKDFRLEEIEDWHDPAYWQVTVSFLLPYTNPPVFGELPISGELSYINYERIYKKVRVNKTTRQIDSLKMFNE